MYFVNVVSISEIVDISFLVAISVATRQYMYNVYMQYMYVIDVEYTWIL